MSSFFYALRGLLATSLSPLFYFSRIVGGSLTYSRLPIPASNILTGYLFCPPLATYFDGWAIHTDFGICRGDGPDHL